MEVCSICGMQLDILTHVHVAKHGLTKDEYREKYGDNSQQNFRITKRKKEEIDQYEAKKASANATRRNYK